MARYPRLPERKISEISANMNTGCVLREPVIQYDEETMTWLKTITSTREVAANANWELCSAPWDIIDGGVVTPAVEAYPVEDYRVNCLWPDKGSIAAEGYGWCLHLEGPCFRAYHQDIVQSLDIFMTLATGERKFWLMCSPRQAGKVIGTCHNYAGLSDWVRGRKATGSFQWAVQHVGESIYIPNGWGHCIFTYPGENGMSAVVSMGLIQPKGIRKRQYQVMKSNWAGHRKDAAFQGRHGLGTAPSCGWEVRKPTQ